MVNISPTEAARRLEVSPQFIRLGLQRGILPFGNAVKMSTKWSYCIPEAALEHYMQYGCKYPEEERMAQ